MSHARRSGARAVFVAGTRPPSAETADLWLIRLRWIAVLGMLATLLLARRLAPALPLVPAGATLVAIALGNVGWLLAVGRRDRSRAPLVAMQIAGDVVALGVMLWFTGGVENPFAGFIVFQIVLAGLLCSARVSFGVTALALIAIAVLSFAPPLPLGGTPGEREQVLWQARLVFLASLSLFLGFFVLIYVRRLEQLRTEGARNEKLAMLGRLVGGMSHELNTPLATILLAARDLVEVARDGANPDAAQLAATVAGEAQRASDILALVRGQVRPEPTVEPVDLAAFVTEHVARELVRLGFTGEHTVTAPGPVRAPVPRAAVAQVLTNLLKNAVEATADEAAPRIDVRLTARRSTIELAVCDNGRGIDAELLDRLGEPFQTTKAAHGGMGMGLYVSSLLADRMGGALAVVSPAGGGAEVTLSLKKSAMPRG